MASKVSCKLGEPRLRLVWSPLGSLEFVRVLRFGVTRMLALQACLQMAYLHTMHNGGQAVTCSSGSVTIPLISTRNLASAGSLWAYPLRIPWTSNGVRRRASQADFVDAEGSNVLVSFWARGDATARPLAESAGVAVVGCKTTMDVLLNE